MSASPSLADLAAVKAVDVHGHYGVYWRQGAPQYYNDCMTGDAALVAERARLSGIEWTVVSPLLALLPRGGANAPAGNDEAFAVVPKTPGLLQWAVVNPLQPATFTQAEAMLKSSWCKGIKIHPEEHRYPIREHGARIFEFAARLRTVILTHSGEELSLPLDFVPFADAFPEAKLILAHLGAGPNGDISHQVRAIQRGRHGNIYTDTSSAKSMFSGLIEWAFREIGPDRILFGTDTPLYFTGSQRRRIEQAEIPPEARIKILSTNARQLLGLA